MIFDDIHHDMITANCSKLMYHKWFQSESGLAASPDAEESRPQRNKGQSKRNESVDERPELRSQKSVDGEDSASDKGSVMEETNNHSYQDLLDAVLKMKDSNGRMICELFLKLPPRQVSAVCH